MNGDFCQIQITFPSKEEAEKTAKMLVEQYKAACAQVIGPITSFYHWEGKLEQSQEWLLLAKTRLCIFDEIVEAVQAVHPYDVPQIVALPIVNASSDYNRWLEEQVR